MTDIDDVDDSCAPVTLFPIGLRGEGPLAHV
jgi:hypothetical protein